MFKDKIKDKIDETTQENWFLSYLGKFILRVMETLSGGGSLSELFSFLKRCLL